MGNITTEDAYKLKVYIDKLWRYLSKHHKELEAFGDMTDESFMTEADIICERLHQVEDMLAKQDAVLEANAAVIEEKDAEIQRLKEMLKELKK